MVETLTKYGTMYFIVIEKRYLKGGRVWHPVAMTNLEFSQESPIFDFACRSPEWWSLLFWGHGLVLINAYIIYKTLCGEGKVKPMRDYEFRHLVCLAKIDPKTFSICNNLVSAVQRQVIRKDMGLHLLILFQHGRQY